MHMAMGAEMIAIDMLMTIHEIWSRVYGLPVPFLWRFRQDWGFLPALDGGCILWLIEQAAVCTLSFIPKPNGYLVGMNRDEQLTRGPARPPLVHQIAGVRTLFPVDTEGGTWIATTETGDTWAILNRNGGHRSPRNLSRGQIVLGAVAAVGADISALLQEVGLFNFLPFRLIGITLREERAREWVWDGEKLSLLQHAWEPKHWFSSGLSDSQAAGVREQIFAGAWRQANAGSAEWLRQAHRSHGPARGAFSVCVHRDDAATVSFTEIEVSGTEVRMRYSPGSPCLEAKAIERSLPVTRAK